MTTTNPAGVLSSADRAYLAQLAAEIVENGNPTGDLSKEMAAAHERRQEFGAEIAAGQSDRARKVRAVLAAKVYGSAITRSAVNQVFAGFAQGAVA